MRNTASNQLELLSQFRDEFMRDEHIRFGKFGKKHNYMPAHRTDQNAPNPKPKEFAYIDPNVSLIVQATQLGWYLGIMGRFSKRNFRMKRNASQYDVAICFATFRAIKRGGLYDDFTQGRSVMLFDSGKLFPEVWDSTNHARQWNSYHLFSVVLTYGAVHGLNIEDFSFVTPEFLRESYSTLSDLPEEEVTRMQERLFA